MSLRLKAFELRGYTLPQPAGARAGAAIRALHFLVYDNRGLAGVGDAAFWPGFGRGEAYTRDALASSTALRGARVGDAADVARLIDESGLESEAAFAVETALLAALAREKGGRISDLLSDATPAPVEAHALVGDDAGARAAVLAGARRLKVKRIEQLRAIRSCVGPDVLLHADLNGRWSRCDADLALAQLPADALALLEQPLAADDLEGHAALRRRPGVRVAVDESVGRYGVDTIAEAGAADLVVLKPMYLGGLRRCLVLARRALELGLRSMVTHAMESAIGRRATLALASVWPGPREIHGVADPRAFCTPLEAP